MSRHCDQAVNTEPVSTVLLAFYVIGFNPSSSNPLNLIRYTIGQKGEDKQKEKEATLGLQA